MTRVPEPFLVHLRRARDLADRHYAEPLDLESLAASGGVSKYHFLRCFAATYGKTPALYLTERRLERAQDLLRHQAHRHRVLARGLPAVARSC